MWARLERPSAAVALLLAAGLAAVPALVPRLRLATLAGATSLALLFALHLSPHRFWNGVLRFYQIRLPFDPGRFPTMHGDVELAVFGFCAATGLAIAAGRRVPAVLILLVGAGWPATLLPGHAQIVLGALILAGALVVLAERA